jgi:hypothetical protein
MEVERCGKHFSLGVSTKATKGHLSTFLLAKEVQVEPVSSLVVTYRLGCGWKKLVFE